MTYFPWPNDSVGNIIGLIQYDNIVTGGYFGYIILITFFTIAFLSLKTFESKQAFAGASFFTMIMAGVFYVIGIVNIKIAWLPILLVALSVLWMYLTD